MEEEGWSKDIKKCPFLRDTVPFAWKLWLHCEENVTAISFIFLSFSWGIYIDT